MKDKRQVLRSVTQNVRNKLGVAIAEVEFQDLWQRTALGVSCVAESIGHCEKVIQEVEKTIARSSADRAEIIDRAIEVIAWEDL